MRLLLTRPEEDSRRLAARLAELGHEALIEPLLSVGYAQRAEWPAVAPSALIVTSRYALSALARAPTALARFQACPVLAVGEATAQTAKDLGFATVIAGPGTAEALLESIKARVPPGPGRLLHLSGEDRTMELARALAAAGYNTRTLTVYTMHPSEALSAECCDALARGALDGVLLMSPRTARIWAGLVGRHGLEKAARRLRHFCISEAVAAGVATLSPRRIDVASAPTLDGTLSLVSA